MTFELTTISPVASSLSVALPQESGIAVSSEMGDASRMQNARQPSQEAIAQFQKAMLDEGVSDDSQLMAPNANDSSSRAPFVRREMPEMQERQMMLSAMACMSAPTVELQQDVSDKTEVYAAPEVYERSVNHTPDRPEISVTAEMTASKAPSAQAPAAMPPIAQAPIAASPVATSPIAQAPIAPSPIAQAPIAPSPIAQAPSAPSPVAPSPIAQAPIAQAPAAPSPVAPSPIAQAPIATPSVVPSLIQSSSEASKAVETVAVFDSSDVAAPVLTPSPTFAAMSVKAEAPAADVVSMQETTAKIVSDVFDSHVTNMAPAIQTAQVADTASAVDDMQSAIAPAAPEVRLASETPEAAVSAPLVSEAPVAPADNAGQKNVEPMKANEPSATVEQKMAKTVKAPAVELRKNVALDERDEEAAPLVQQAPIAVAPDAPRVMEAASLAVAPVAVHEVNAASAAMSARSAELVEAAEAVCSAIMVSQGLSKSEGEIHIQLKADVLGGSDIRLSVNGNALAITFNVVSDAVQQLIERNLPHFEQHLAQRIHAYQIAVDIIKRKVQK